MSCWLDWAANLELGIMFNMYTSSGCRMAGACMMIFTLMLFLQLLYYTTMRLVHFVNIRERERQREKETETEKEIEVSS